MTISKSAVTLLCVSGIGLGGLMANPVLAQVEEIVITATRRPAALLALAGNLGVVEDLEFIGAAHISDVLNRLPGVNIQHGSGQEHLTSIRSPVLTGGAGAGSFLYLEDGIALRSPGFANVNGLFEAHTEQAGRIEVVRGPGSALYGSNAVHGLINVLSLSPDQLKGSRVSLDVGSHDLVTGKVLAHFAGENANGLLALTLKHDGGARAQSGLDQQKATVRSDWKKGENSFTFLVSFANLNQETAGFIKGKDAYEDKGAAKSNPNPEAFRNAHALRSYLRWSRPLNANLTLDVTPFFRKTDMDFVMHFLPGQAIEENGQTSFGVQSRLYKDMDSGNLVIAGLDLERTEGFLVEEQAGPDVFSFVTGTHYDYDVTAMTLSPFVHSEWQLSDNTRATAGLRVDVTRYEYSNNVSENPAMATGRYQRPADRSDSFVTATPKLGLTHKLSDATSVFALYARGQRAPQTTDLYRLQSKQVAGGANAETMDSFELGMRGTKGALRFELTGYLMRKDNFFFRDTDGFNVSDGKTGHKGVELGFSLAALRNVDLSGALTYGHHSYRFDNLVGAVPTDASSEDIRKGNDIDTAPRVLANLRLGWRPLEALRGELEWVHMDGYYLDGANLHRYGGHDLFNIRAHYRLNSFLTLSGRVLNIANTAYADRADYAFGDYRYFPGDERFFAVGVIAGF